jgi:hypothetical protein
MIADATMRALGEMQARERDVLQAYTAGAAPERSDVAQEVTAIRDRDPLSSVPPSGAYFVTADPSRSGGSSRLYTRDGSFRLTGEALTDAQGRPVLGYRNGSPALHVLQADPVDTALGAARDARIDADGTFSYERTAIDPRTGRPHSERVVVGRLAVARFPAATPLRNVDSQHAVAPPGVIPHLGTPADGTFAQLVPGARSSSGIDLERGLERLDDAYVEIAALRAAGTVKSSVQKTVMDLLT